MDGYYFLRQVWVAGNARGRELPRSYTEFRLAQNYDKMESVIVAANIALKCLRPLRSGEGT